MNPEFEPVPLGPAETGIEAVVDVLPATESTNGFAGILASLCSMHKGWAQLGRYFYQAIHAIYAHSQYLHPRAESTFVSITV